MRKTILFLLLAVACAPRVQEEPAKTTFQTSQGWRPTIDIRADAVMVYGANGRVPLEDRLASPGAAMPTISPASGMAGPIGTKGR